MNSKIKILIGVFVVGIVLIGGYLFWNVQMKKVDCSEITSMLNIEQCIEKRIGTIGVLECEKLSVPRKAGVHYLKFADGIELRFLEEYPNCKNYDGKIVKVIGELYQCGEFDQCAGIGLTHIESLDLVK